MSIHFYTSFSYSYLNRARVLAATLKKHHPDWILWAVITDHEPEDFRFSIENENFDRMIFAEDLMGQASDSWLFKHDIVEACTAVKGKALQHLLNQEGCAKVIYLDPDIAVFNSLNPVVELLDHKSIILTPHQLTPDAATNKRAIRDNEITSLAYGVYNLGFIAVANDTEGRRFAQWWADRLYDFCHDDLASGIFVDQKWCDLIPSFFEGVYILRDPGYNVASWNLSQRVMRFNPKGEALINGKPLRFYHFTKLGPVGDVMTQRYARDNIEIYELWWWYRNAVERSSAINIPAGWWHYKSFSNGVKIPKDVRVLYRHRVDLQNAFSRPFDVADGFYDWLHAEGMLTTE